MNDNDIMHFNAVLEEWKGTFTTPPEIDLFFGITRSGMLTLNNVILCQARDTSPDLVSYDSEEIYIETNHGTTFTVYIRWPFEGKAKISQIMKNTPIFICES